MVDPNPHAALNLQSEASTSDLEFKGLCGLAVTRLYNPRVEDVKEGLCLGGKCLGVVLGAAQGYNFFCIGCIWGYEGCVGGI